MATVTDTAARDRWEQEAEAAPTRPQPPTTVSSVPIAPLYTPEELNGFDAAEYFTKYPSRFISMHVQGWSAPQKKITAVGQGTLDWKKIFTAAKTGGIKNYFVEMKLEMMKASVPYLRQLAV